MDINLHNLNTLLEKYEDILSNISNILNLNKDNRLKELKSKIKRFQANFDIINRKCLKVVLVGQTNNGKSKLVNELLNMEFLPSRNFQKTDAIISIEESKEANSYYLDENGEKKDLDLLKNEIFALKSNQVNIREFYKTYLVNNREILNHLNIIDSPGLGKSAKLNEMVEKYCIDGDLFILMINSLNDISDCEKIFLRKVNKSIAKPDFLIVFNKCDLLRKDEDFDYITQQFKANSIEFFKEMHYDDIADIESRIFFISTKFLNDNDNNLPELIKTGNRKLKLRLLSYQNQLNKNHSNNIKEIISIKDKSCSLIKSIHNDVQMLSKKINQQKYIFIKEIDSIKKEIFQLKCTIEETFKDEIDKCNQEIVAKFKQNEKRLPSLELVSFFIKLRLFPYLCLIHQEYYDKRKALLKSFIIRKRQYFVNESNQVSLFTGLIGYLLHYRFMPSYHWSHSLALENCTDSHENGLNYCLEKNLEFLSIMKKDDQIKRILEYIEIIIAQQFDRKRKVIDEKLAKLTDANKMLISYLDSVKNIQLYQNGN